MPALSGCASTWRCGSAARVTTARIGRLMAGRAASAWGMVKDVDIFLHYTGWSTVTVSVGLILDFCVLCPKASSSLG